MSARDQVVDQPAIVARAPREVAMYLQLVLESYPHTAPMACTELASELAQLLRRELAVPLTVRRVIPAALDGRGVPRGDPVAVVALILSIPSAVVATHDLASRLKLKDCLQRVVARARSRGARAVWRTAADTVDLPGEQDRTLDEILDELSRAQEPPQAE